VLDAVDLAISGELKRSFCAVRPPGHHALRDAAMGFCFFGSVGVAAQYARQKHQVGRVLIVDWDVHHGNGTQALVEKDADLRFVSMHQWPWYPGTGAEEDRGPHGTVRNVPRPAGLDPKAYRDALLAAVDDITRGWTPELLLLSAGFDSMIGDPLGGFTLGLEDFTILTRALVERADTWCNGRLVSALEGGYNPPNLADAVVTHITALE
jgi:acetoin utilization deacetylase AcuC-like enzyme